MRAYRKIAHLGSNIMLVTFYILTREIQQMIFPILVSCYKSVQEILRAD
jgi:hypothetical protein